MSRALGFHSLLLAAVLAALFAAIATAASNTVTVPGTADVWLAGQANGTILVGGFASNDVAPANSPVLASTGLNMTAGNSLTFSATGTTNFGGCASPSPDGGGACGNFTSNAFFGISTYAGPINAVVGVFLNASTPGGAAPAGLDFTTLASRSQATNS